MKTLPSAFFNQPTVDAARGLLGCMLTIRRGGAARRFMIVETEAYDGFDDLASHASRGKTTRNEVMFRRAGHIYVYFTYGMHWMLNIVTGPKGYPAAVLIRGAMSEDGTTYGGPAKLTKALGIDGSFNGKTLSRKAGLWIEAPKDGNQKRKITASPRVGVGHSGPIWSKKRYRFVLDH